MLTEKLQIFTRIYKQFDPSFSLNVTIHLYSVYFEYLLVDRYSNSLSTNTNEELFGYFRLFVIFGQLFDERYQK